MKPRLFALSMTAIAGIIGLEFFALAQGVDGTGLALAISGIVGVATGGGIKLYEKLKRGNNGH